MPRFSRGEPGCLRDQRAVDQRLAAEECDIDPLAGRSLIEEAPPGAWPDEPQRFLATDQATAPDDLAAGCRGGFVQGFEAGFDPDGFQVPRDEVRALDRTRQWLLEAGRQAVREAGRDDLRGTPAAVVVGNLSYPTATLCDLAYRVLIEPRLASLANLAPSRSALQ